MSTNNGKLQWHPAFNTALHIEFEKELDILHILEEYPLSRMPMKMDVLIIKNSKDIPIHKNIGHIFRAHNIILIIISRRSPKRYCQTV